MRVVFNEYVPSTLLPITLSTMVLLLPCVYAYFMRATLGEPQLAAGAQVVWDAFAAPSSSTVVP